MDVIIIGCNFFNDYPENNNWDWIHVKYYDRHTSDAIYKRREKISEYVYSMETVGQRKRNNNHFKLNIRHTIFHMFKKSKNSCPVLISGLNYFTTV